MGRILLVIGWSFGLAVAMLALGKLAAVMFPPRTRWEDTERRCALGGGHPITTRAITHGRAYDGSQLYICRKHLLDEKRLRETA